MATTERDYYELLGVARDASETEIKKAFRGDRKSTRLNSSHDQISYAVFCLKKKKIYAVLPTKRMGNLLAVKSAAARLQKSLTRPRLTRQPLPVGARTASCADIGLDRTCRTT